MVAPKADFAGPRAVVLAEARRRGFPSEAVLRDTVLVASYADDRARFSAWILDSMLALMRAVETGDRRVAIRLYGQVREYRGRLGGFLPSALSDAFTACEVAVVDMVAPR